MINLHRHLLENLLIPVKQAVIRPGNFIWPRKAVLACSCSDDYIPLEQIKEDNPNYSIETRPAQNSSGKTSLRSIRDKSIANPQAYRLEIALARITIFSCMST